MKYFGTILAVVALAFASCEKKVVEAPPPPPPTPIPATPAPVVVATPPPATPELAPPGVFYLVEAARIETNDGIIGLKPGTGVKLVRPGVYLSPQGEVQLRDDQITNDMGFARRVLMASRQAESATQAAVAVASQEANAQQAAAVTGAPNIALPAGMGERTAKLAQIRLQMIALQAQVRDIDAQAPTSHRSSSTIHGGTLSEQRRVIEQQLRDLQTQQSLIMASPQ